MPSAIRCAPPRASSRRQRGTSRVRVLALTNGWPTERFPEYCVFNRRQVDDIRALGVEVDVAFVNARERGKWAYAECLPRISGPRRAI